MSTDAAGGDTEDSPRPTAGIRWPRLAAEMGAIVFGVLLALLVDDWRETRSQEEALGNAMLSLRAELERNQRILEELLPFHEAMRDTLSARFDELRAERSSGTGPGWALPTLTELGFEAGYTVGPAFATGAWEASRSSGALARAGLDELFLLSTAYTSQGRLTRALDALQSEYRSYLAATVAPDQAAPALARFTASLDEVVETEATLCASYRTLARRLTGRNSPADRRCGSGNASIR